MADSSPASTPDALQLSLLPFVARCGYCKREEEVPTRALADRWALDHLAECPAVPRSRSRRRDDD